MSELTPSAGGKWWRRDLPALTAIVLLGILVYAHTLQAPWYLDDAQAITENSTVRSLPEAIGNLFAERGIAVLTFALNYRVGGTEVVGYHLVNIAIHLATSCLVFLLLKRVFRDRPLLALGGALIFVAHPLQTQAVTYIVQRLTSLAALFFFLAVYLYARAREAAAGPQGRMNTCGWLFYGGALLCGAMAVLTKQNTAVLPVALLLFDRYFLTPGRTRPWRQLLAGLAPFCLAPLWLGISSLLLPMLDQGGGLGTVVGLPTLVHLRHNTPLHYLFTEFSVIWLYLRLLFVPSGQALDYDVPIVANLWNWASVVGLVGIVLLLVVATLLRKRLPVVSAGIFWFFLALAVESTIIPLDPVFEHRLYIPMFGFALVVMGGVARLPRRGAAAAIVLIIGVLAVLTWQRNALWNDPVAFLEDNLRRAPLNERVYLNLANAYMRNGRIAEAQHSYEQALSINPQYALIHINLSRVYAIQGEYEKAVAIAREGLRIDPTHYALYNNLAAYYNALGDHHAAADVLQTAIRLNPDDPLVYLNLGMAYEGMGFPEKAIPQYRHSTQLAPNDPQGHFFLGNAMLKAGDARGALPEFLAAYRLNPKHAGTLYKIALVSIELGDMATARDFAAQLQRLDPEMAGRLSSMLR